MSGLAPSTSPLENSGYQWRCVRQLDLIRQAYSMSFMTVIMKKLFSDTWLNAVWYILYVYHNFRGACCILQHLLSHLLPPPLLTFGTLFLCLQRLFRPLSINFVLMYITVHSETSENMACTWGVTSQATVWLAALWFSSSAIQPKMVGSVWTEVQFMWMKEAVMCSSLGRNSPNYKLRNG